MSSRVTTSSIRAVGMVMLCCCGHPSAQPAIGNRDSHASVTIDAAAVDAPTRWLCVGDYCSTSAEGCMMHRAGNAALLGPDEYCEPKPSVFCAGRPHGDIDEDCQPTLAACKSAYHSRPDPCVEVR